MNALLLAVTCGWMAATPADEPVDRAVGIWEGPIELPGGVQLRVVFRVKQGTDGALAATMDSPEQGAFGIKVESVARDGDGVTLAVKPIRGEFAGQVEADGAVLAGRWKQGGASFPLRLKKVERVTEAGRPQLPKPPFPYRAEEVAYDSKAPGVRIAGTLTLPPGDGPFPAVLLISGSGPQDRDETLMGHKPFLVLADDLTRRGVAVLRVDDRGVGQSTGAFAAATTFDFADDAEAGFAYLRGRKEVNPAKVGLAGHSEGGLIAPLVAARVPEVGFLVLLAGPGLPGGEILVAQQGLILQAAGTPKVAVAIASAVLAAKIAAVNGGAPKAVQGEPVAELPEAERKALAEGVAPSGFETPWMRTFLKYDPRPTLARVRCPILAINGELDLQVPCRANLDAIAKAVAAGGNAGLVARPMPGLNHLFQTAKTGAPSEYSKMEETFAPAALRVIGD